MPTEEKRRNWVRLSGALALAALIGVAAFFVWRALAQQGLDLASMSPADAQRFAASWGAWSAAGSVLLMVLHSFVPLPAEIIAIANGMLFGTWLGIALTWTGAMLGAIFSCALARWLGRPFVHLLVSERAWQRLETLSVTPTTLLFVRLVPLISFNLVNYAAGLLGVRWWPFLWTTALGILPLTVATVLIGTELLQAPLWLWLVVAAALLVLWLALQRRRRAATTLSGGK
jgi:uncharacterized membrane protein YdjX (TVP38/TMEM64 family)